MKTKNKLLKKGMLVVYIPDTISTANTLGVGIAFDEWQDNSGMYGIGDRYFVRVYWSKNRQVSNCCDDSLVERQSGGIRIIYP